MRLSRRMMLGGAATALATRSFANPLLTSPRPILRINEPLSSARIIARAGLPGDIGFVIADTQTGEVIDSVAPDLPQPPASVTKAVTACFAHDHLGSQFRFKTRVFADGPINDGILDGNLILVGGGDPTLLTDDLAELAARLKASGIIEVRGEFLVWDNALTNIHEIDDTQLDYLGYNPSITGLNLNFNRVYFEWKRDGEDYQTVLDARSQNFRPIVTTAEMEIVDRRSPVFTYRDVGDVDAWTVARPALNDEGARWLPVRHPALYAGEVFATFARSHGIVLKPPREVANKPRGTVLAGWQSPVLPDVLRDMLRYSTNITAEAVGLSATKARTGQAGDLDASAQEMADWVKARTGGTASFADHSGLGDTSRISAADMVGLLSAEGIMPTLRPLMKPFRMFDDDGGALSVPEDTVLAKTGTLNFVSTLAGYIRTIEGRDLAFAFFSADLQARAAGKLAGSERPPGARGWNSRAKRVQQDLLRHWINAPV